MSEQIKNEVKQAAISPIEASEVNEVQAFTMQDILDMVLKKWYWFVLSVIAFLGMGVLYIMQASPVYQRNATIMVKDNRKGSGMSEMAAFSDMAGFMTRRNVDNEVVVLQSRRLMMEVVQRLGLTTSYTTRSGLRMVDLYKHSPIDVRFSTGDEGKGCSFNVLLQEDSVFISEFRYSKNTGNESDEDDEFSVASTYGAAIETPTGRIVVDKTQYMDEDYVGKTITVAKGRKDDVANRYRTACNSSVADKMSSIINISLCDISPQRAEDIINTLIDVYNEDAINDKRQTAETTASFISDRLSIVGRELSEADENVRTFKGENKVVDIKADVQQNMTENSKLKSEILSTESQIAMAKFIKEYLNDPAKELKLIPVTSLGDKNTTNLSTQINAYNETLLRREKLLQNSSDNSPVIQQLDVNRIAIKNAILASLESFIETQNILLTTLQREENRTKSLIALVPTQEQQFLTIARTQRIKEELYLYLLNKREETALSMAITENSARIVDSAFGSRRPIAPRRSLILLVMLVLGVALPFGIIYVREMLDTSVHSKREIERYTRVPYLGDIPRYDGKLYRGIAVRENGRDNVSEAFRIIRANMGFMNTSSSRQQVIMVSSSNAHAGKTFVSMNLGITLAYSGARVLMIDLDLRRRTLSKHMGQRNNANGVSKYMSDQSVNVSDIISKSELHESFDFIYAGLQPPNPAEMLMSNRLDSLIEECRKMYDYIIVDSVPAMVIADALIASRIADLSIYIVREGLLDRRQLPDIDALYCENKLRNMCIVLNGSTSRSHRYGYGYGYTYSYKDDDENNSSLWGRLLTVTGLRRLIRRRDARRSIY